MRSLHSRLLLAASLVLAGFLGATGLALDTAFRNSAEAAMQERLQSYIYALLAAADEDSDGRMIPPQALPEPRFSKPDSGLYAVIAEHDGETRWQSESLTGREIPNTYRQQPGRHHFSEQTLNDLQLHTLAFGVAWEDYAGDEALYTFTVAEDRAGFQAEVDSFRSTLWRWLGGMALVLLLAQGAILRWGLRPLRTVTSDLQAIQQGHSDRLDGQYPRELSGLTRKLGIPMLEYLDQTGVTVRAGGPDEGRALLAELCGWYLDDDELVEVTPDAIRMRKRILDETERARRLYVSGWNVWDSLHPDGRGRSHRGFGSR